MVAMKLLDMPKTEKTNDLKNDVINSRHEMEHLFDSWLEKKVLNAESKLENLQRRSRERSRKFVNKKKLKGYVRKSFWLNLSKEDSLCFLAWLKEQDPQSLRDVASLNVSLSSLLLVYQEHISKKTN